MTLTICADNPSNGDVIASIFPDAEIRYYKNLSGMKSVDVTLYKGVYGTMTLDRDWWDAPYKAESEDER